MRRSPLLVLLALPVLAACGSSPTRTVTKPTPAPRTTAQTSAPVYFQGAVGNPAQRPGALELTADGTLSVERVQWRSWGEGQATGTGNALYHGCNPNCAQAPTHTALVSIQLSQIRVCGGRRFYSGVTLRLNSGRLLDEQFLQRSWSPC